MELRQLAHFVAVAEEGQFTRAATRCDIAQSALSASVRVLENELGAPLFVRTTRRVALTEVGRALLIEARRTLTAAEIARTVVHDTKALLRGRLVVGGIPTFTLLDQSDLLCRFSALHPGVDIQYRRDGSGALITGVRDGKLAIAFVSLPAQPLADLRTIVINTAPIRFCCRADHPLADRRKVTIEELAGESFAGGPIGDVGLELVDLAFAATGTQRTVKYECSDLGTTLDFVEQGLGVTLMIEALNVGRPGLRTVPITDKSLVWTLAAITPPAEYTTAAAQELINLMPPGPLRARRTQPAG
jgi:DNA-binding transcriptional LysR family regulator